MMRIRPQTDADDSAVRQLNEAVFPTPAEADLVARLRAEANPVVSLVAEDDGAIIGHILFSPATLATDAGCVTCALGPMAVLPGRQRQGIGSSLVRLGLDECAKLGCRAVFVLGHADYYPRFGFVPAARFGIAAQFEVPDEVFMALELEPGALAGKAGAMRYHEAFDAL